MPGQSRGPSQSQGVAPKQEVAAPGATPDLSGGVGNAEVAASIGKGGGEEASALLAPEPQLKPGVAAAAPEAKAPAATAPASKAPAAQAAQLKPGVQAPDEEKASGTAKGDLDAGKQGDKAAGKGAKDLKADKGEKVAAKAKDAGPAEKGGGDGKPGKGGGGDAPPADAAKGGGAPGKGDKGEKGGNAAAAFNAASGSGGGGGRKSEAPAAASGPAPAAPVANTPTGGAPTGGGGGGGGGGRAPGGSAVATVAQEAAPVVEIPVADNVKDTMANFAAASPSQQANAWPTLGAALDAKAETETSKLDEGVPEFHAVMGGDANAGGGTTDVATPGTVSNLAGEAGGPVPEPVLAPTVDPGQARYNQGVTRGLDRLGEDAAKDQKASAIAAGIGAIQTSDGAVAVSPGPAPAVPLQGDSDPARITEQTSSMNEQAAAALVKAREAVVASPGAELVQPLELDEAFEVPALTMEGIGDTPEAEEMQKYVEQALPADIQASFDEINAPEFEASLAEAEGQVGAAVDTRDLDAQAELDKASAENAKMASDAQAQQEASVAEQRSAITSKRDATMAAQASAVAGARSQANDASMAEQRKIDTRIAQDNSKITNEYARAEQKAEGKVAQGERDAADKKRKAEEDAENKSWWEKACDWVADALSALADIINSIFDAIRSAVTAILDAVKSLANAIIDAAVSFIQSAIAALGSLLKGLIQDLLGSVFPELADALCSFVDSAVKFAQEQVAVIGDKLKKAVAAACGVIAGVLNKILDVFQSAVNMAIAIASAAITGDWNGVLMKMIEAALRICGIDPEEFYAYVGKAEDTIQIILDDPGHFIGNIIEAVGMGFGQFGDNFLDHLQNGFVGWLTGQSGEAGITMPDDPMSMGGVLDIALQVLGITPEGIEEMATERIGEENVEKIKFVWGFVESAISGGLEGLWDHLSEFLDGIYDEVIGAIQEWLMEKVVMAAISKIATMWNPIGAIVQALITAWNVYQWLQAQAARIMGIVKSVVDSMHDIATGNLGGAANMVEGALAGLVPVAIDLLASLLGISGIGKKVQEIVGGIRTWVKDAINKMIDKFLGLFTGGGKDEAKPEEAQPDEPKPDAAQPEGEPDTGSLTLQGNWGTSSPILYHYKAQDREDLAELRAHGSYQLEIVDGAAADRQWKRGEGDNAKYDNKGMHDWTRSLLLKHFTTNVANAHMAVDDVLLATSHKGFEMATAAGLSGELAAYGMKAKAVNIQGLDKKGGETPASGFSEVGKDVAFTAGGESHRVFVQVQGGQATIMVASTIKSVDQHLADFEAKANTAPFNEVDPATHKSVKDEVTPVIGRARQLSAQGDSHADQLAKKSPEKQQTADEAMNNTIVSEEKSIADCFTTLFGLFKDTGATEGAKSIADKLKDFAEGPKLAVMLAVGADKAATDALAAQGASELRRAGHIQWHTQLGNDATYLAEVAKAFGDPIAPRKLVEVTKDKQVGGLISGFYKEVKGALHAKLNAGDKTVDVYALMQDVAKQETYQRQGNQQKITGKLWRVAGLNKSLSYNLTNQYKEAVVERFVLGMDPALRPLWAAGPGGKFDEATTGFLAAEFIKQRGGFPIAPPSLDKEFQGSAGTTWWTDGDFSKAITLHPGDKVGQFGAMCELGALQPSWYTGGFLRFATDGHEIDMRKPSVFDGMMSPYWVQVENAEDWGITGGGEREWVAGDVKASSVDAASLTVHPTGDTLQAVIDKIKATGTSSLGRSDQTNATDKKFQSLGGGTNQGCDTQIQNAPATPSTTDKEKAVTESVGKQTKDMQQQSKDNGGNLPAATMTNLNNELPEVKFTDVTGKVHKLQVTGKKVIAHSDPKPVVEAASPGGDFATVKPAEKPALAAHTSSAEAHIEAADKALKNGNDGDVKTEAGKARAEMAAITPILSTGGKVEAAATDAKTATKPHEPGDFEVKAAAFEQRLGAKAVVDDRATGAVKAMLEKAWTAMEAKANLDKKNKDLDDAMNELLMKCGTDIKDVWAGRVGNNIAAIPMLRKVMQGGGNLREMCNHLGGFMENVLGPDLFTKSDAYMSKIISEAHLNRKAIEAAKADAQARQDKAFAKDPSKGTTPAGDMINNGTPISTPGSKPVENKAAADAQFAKKGDTRNNDNTGSVYANPISKDDKKKGVKQTDLTPNANMQSQTTKAEFEKSSPLSETEKSLGTDILPWIEGVKAWDMVESDTWVKAARDLQMPLAGGISGTTGRLMQSNVLLGRPASAASVRYAALGYLIPIKAHSFHEIMQAGASWVPYTPGDYKHIAPLADAEVAALEPPERPAAEPTATPVAPS